MDNFHDALRTFATAFGVVLLVLFVIGAGGVYGFEEITGQSIVIAAAYAVGHSRGRKAGQSEAEHEQPIT